MLPQAQPSPAQPIPAHPSSAYVECPCFACNRQIKERGGGGGAKPFALDRWTDITRCVFQNPQTPKTKLLVPWSSRVSRVGQESKYHRQRIFRCVIVFVKIAAKASHLLHPSQDIGDGHGGPRPLARPAVEALMPPTCQMKHGLSGPPSSSSSSVADRHRHGGRGTTTPATTTTTNRRLASDTTLAPSPAAAEVTQTSSKNR